MITESITQDQTTPKYAHHENTIAFRSAYGRLNSHEQKREQKLFCNTYDISPVAFRARVGGTTRVSDTELAFLKKRVATYFPQ